MRRILAGSAAIAACMLLLGACGHEAGKQIVPPQDITLFTSDGANFAARRYRIDAPSGIAPPGLLFIGDAGTAPQAWDPFAALACAKGYVALATDDASVPALAVCKKALIETGADPARLAVVGAGQGGCVAVHLAQDDLDLLAVVVLSPTRDCADYDIEAAVTSLRDCPLLLLASEDDLDAATTARALDDVAGGFCELRVFPGTLHGIALPTGSASAGRHVFAWLETILPQ